MSSQSIQVKNWIASSYLLAMTELGKNLLPQNSSHQSHHCERSEAIQTVKSSRSIQVTNWIASSYLLAMTELGRKTCFPKRALLTPVIASAAKQSSPDRNVLTIHSSDQLDCFVIPPRNDGIGEKDLLPRNSTSQSRHCEHSEAIQSGPKTPNHPFKPGTRLRFHTSAMTVDLLANVRIKIPPIRIHRLNQN
jgi:hypothetical protein